MAEVTFGEWLKRRRKVVGLTQEQLAEQVSCSTITLRKIEAEERRPSAQIVERLAEIFNIPSKEQTTFLRFARGDWKAAPSESIRDIPWRASTTSPRSNLPVSLTSLIGRQQELIKLCEYLSNPDVRLVTLIGPPGIGKTRLSIESARAALNDFPDGVFFVALAPLNDPTLVASTIGQTLRFEGRGRTSAMELLKDGIADKQILLVLDNFEHLLEAASIVPDLLTACPKLKILVTSRESLRVPGEWQYAVPSLAVPQISKSKEIDLTTPHEFSALTLFTERARATHSDFKLDPENSNVVAAICTQLDGLPLAIELIAARVRLMSPQELLSRMDNRFTLYADGMRALPERQKTLHNAIAWSYDLLNEEEQKLFAQIGVFAGGFTLEAAAQVTGNPQVLTGITALLDKSLLQRTIAERGETRFTMLFTIREFALNRLNAMNETAKMRDQHLRYFLDLAEKADKEIHGPRQIEWLDHLEVEHDNYRAVLDWCITSGQTEPALRLIGSFSGLGRFWSVRSYFSEARGWFDKVRASPDVSVYPIAYATALNGMSFIALLQNDFGPARAMAEESQRICEHLGTDGELGLAGALLAIGIAALWRDNDIDLAEPCYKQAAAIYQVKSNRWEYALASLRLGVAARHRGNYEQSQSFFETSLGIFRELDDAFGLGRVHAEMGYLFLCQGNYDHARRLYEQALAYDRGLRFQIAMSTSLTSLGRICRVQGDYDQAETLLEEALRICREFGLFDDIAHFDFGCISLHRGDYAEARARYNEYLRISQRHDVQVTIGEGLMGLAAAAAGLHQCERAALLAGAGQGVFDTVEYKMPPHDRIEIDPLLQSARDELGKAAFEELAAEGGAMTMEQAVAYALEDQIL